MKRIGLLILVLALIVAGVFVLDPVGEGDSGLIEDPGRSGSEEIQGRTAGISESADQTQAAEATAKPGMSGLTEDGRRRLDEGAPGLIRGRVLDLLSEPVAGIQVYLHLRSETSRQGSGAPILARALSDERGVFELPRLELGNYSLRAVGEGWAQALLAVRLTAERPKRPGVILRMQRGYDMEGVVVDPSGKPVADAWVLARGSQESRSVDLFQEVRSDAEGHFAFQSLPGGRMHVLAWAEGRMLGATTGDASKDDPLRLELPEEGPFAMSFSMAERKDGQEDRPADVRVRLYLVRGSTSVPLPGPLREGQVPSRGELRIHGLREGSYQIALRSPSVILDKPVRQQSLRVDKPTAKIQLAWRTPVGLEGKLIYKSGQAAAGITVQAWISSPRETVSVESDQGGRFAFPQRFDKKSNPWIVLAEPGLLFESGKNRSVWMRIKPGQKDNVFTLVRMPLISGRVIDDEDRPVADARVWSHELDKSWRPYGQAYTDDKGEFHLVVTRDSKSPIVLEASYDASLCEKPVPLEGGGKVAQEGLVIRLSEGAKIEGQVVDAKGKGLAQVSVSATFVPKGQGKNVRPSPWGRMQHQSRGAVTNAEGRFRIQGVAPGSWKVGCRSRGRRMRGPQPVVRVVRGKSQHGLRLVLAEGLSIEGRMVTESGKPVSRAWIMARFDGKLAQGESGGRANAQTGVDGSFKLTGLRPGNFVLTSYPSWQMQKELGLRKPGPDGKSPMQLRGPMKTKVMAGIKDYRWQVSLPSFGEIRVRLAQSGPPLQRIKVRFHTAKQNWIFDVPVMRGLITMKHVLTGSYELTFQSPRFEDQKLPAQVHEGQVTDLGMLSLVDLAEVAGRVVDENGQPLAGVWIGLDNRLANLWQTYDLSKGPEQFGGRVLTQSNSRGQFIVPIKGHLRVYGFKPGYAPGALSWAPPTPAKPAGPATHRGNRGKGKKGAARPGPPTKEPVLVLHRAGEITIQAPRAAKGQRTRWYAKLTRIPTAQPPAGKKAPRPWSRSLRLPPGTPTRYIGLQAGRYFFQAIDFTKAREYAKKSVPGQSYYEELLIQVSSHRLIRIP